MIVLHNLIKIANRDAEKGGQEKEERKKKKENKEKEKEKSEAKKGEVVILVTRLSICKLKALNFTKLLWLKVLPCWWFGRDPEPDQFMAARNVLAVAVGRRLGSPVLLLPLGPVTAATK